MLVTKQSCHSTTSTKLSCLNWSWSHLNVPCDVLMVRDVKVNGSHLMTRTWRTRGTKGWTERGRVQISSPFSLFGVCCVVERLGSSICSWVSTCLGKNGQFEQKHTHIHKPLSHTLMKLVQVSHSQACQEASRSYFYCKPKKTKHEDDILIFLNALRSEENQCRDSAIRFSLSQLKDLKETAQPTFH